MYPVIASALILVGFLMMKSISQINWNEITEALPAFVVIITMPLTFSIANGIAIGFIVYAVAKLFSGRPEDINPAVLTVAALGVLHYAFN